MDSKTRVLMSLSREKPDKVPFNFGWIVADVSYEEEIGHRHWRVTHYGADVIESSWFRISFGPAVSRMARLDIEAIF